MPIGGSSIMADSPFLFTSPTSLGGGANALPANGSAMSVASCRSIFRWVGEVLAAILPLTPPLVCQGNTDDAGDCVVFYNKLNDVYSSAVNKGFSPSTGNPSTTRASQTDFKNADGYDVLYWSSHGNFTPMLNLGIHSYSSISYSAAYSAWNSTNDKLKVAILAACHRAGRRNQS